MDEATSEALRSRKVQAYVEDLRASIPDASEEIIAALATMYDAGWRDCWRQYDMFTTAHHVTEVNRLRDKGWAVILVGPGDFSDGNIDRRSFEDRMYALSLDVLENMRPDDD